ncbi:MAG: hypothetical protein K8E24_010570 [Methanobacterium paludis]|nr:hypothetical protein [Methanobacterium paludis]
MEKERALTGNLFEYSPFKKINNISKPFFKVSKKVKSKEIEIEKINNSTKKRKLLNVIESLMELGKSKNLEDLRLRNNPTYWINSLFSDYPNIDRNYFRFLIDDFTGAMNTTMKEDNKYVVSVMDGKRLILCHSRMGEETITPNWDVKERMLDKDNVIRFVSFENNDNEIDVIFYEEERTVFLTDWLGIPEKEAFYDKGGKNKFYFDIHGLPLKLECTDKDFENLMESEDLKIENNSIKLPKTVKEFNITQIRRANKPYNNIQDFIKEFIPRMQDLLYYKEEYKKLKGSLDSIISTIIDYENEVKIVCGNKEKIIKKNNKKFYVVFCDNNIEIAPSFVDKIKTSLINGEKIKIYHAGMNFNENPLKIENLEIFNDLNDSTASFIIKYLNGNDHSDIRKIELLYTIFQVLSIENTDSPLANLFREIMQKLLEDTNFSSKINEDEVVELKSRDFLTGNTKEIVSKLTKDVENKMKDSEFKLYIFGYDERIEEYEPFPTTRFDDSRILSLNKYLRESTNFENLNLFKIDKDNNQCILAMTVRN